VAGASMSPGLAAMTDRAAAAGRFAKASGLLADLAGVHLTAKRVERSAEASGAASAAADRDRAALITARKLVPLPPSPLPDKLYAAIDGTGVPMVPAETAGRDGKGEDGRARTREVKLAVFFTQDKLDKDGYPVRDPGSSSYLATFEPAGRQHGDGRCPVGKTRTMNARPHTSDANDHSASKPANRSCGRVPGLLRPSTAYAEARPKMAVAIPSPGRYHPMTLPARRTTRAPSVAYKTLAGRAQRLLMASPVTRSSQAKTVRTTPATAIATATAHAAAAAGCCRSRDGAHAVRRPDQTYR